MRSVPHQGMMEHHHSGPRPDYDARSGVSTKSARSSVLERARAYNQRIDEQRAKSMERASQDAPVGGGAVSRSHSAGRVGGGSMNGNRVSTRERAMQSVRNEPSASYHHHQHGGRALAATPNMASQQQLQHQQQQQHHHSRSQQLPQQQQQYRSNHPTPNASNVRGQSLKRPDPTTPLPAQSQRTGPTARPAPNNKSPTSKSASQPKEQQEAVVTPELLVDALSGHEDGLLAIAERLMEHYDAGYDVMGEAIIDAFADVQKLFQHVVEAAHMEGAAFEAQRREAEMAELRKQVGGGDGAFGAGMLEEAAITAATPSGGPSRHDEFIDQDVKDVLGDAIRKGTSLRDANQHLECYKMYETACQSASALLPVDSDHRGRLQLSIARAESMSPDRACAILRYAMDDVLRSGLRAGKASLPDVSKRGDCVLSKPKEHPSLNGSSHQAPGVVQSSEEALASLVEEMKEVMSAPVYDNTPLQDCADRFWKALGEAQKAQTKTEERLEQALGKLKGEYLMARAEWEEKLTASQDQTELYKTRYMEAKNGYGPSSAFSTPNGKLNHHHHHQHHMSSSHDNGGDAYLEQARAAMRHRETRQESSSDGNGQHQPTNFDSIPRLRGSNSVASLGTSLSHHARSIVGTFNCTGAGATNAGVGEVPSQPMVRPSVRKSKSTNSVGGTPTSSSSRGRPRRGRSRTIREGTSSAHTPPSREHA